ncbi:FAD binding domain-containing protein [Hymenobacter persicinus]|uniref:2Fe-2S iron-sulfur cluster binding domain-containing protein n=1 Tax=Hymenobacter persicinus TaxID=2025506 RepID=A0A4Q5L9D9_9BACT|nr:FAD binding domain-containing protein [Hymenobacter persicinus]RYU77641.1 2Fe-2S iron-sulfur cluster binding domain-containing protein [Hymenobacter persicinus]
MLQFYLNNQRIRTEQPAGSTLLDFVRYNQHLTGTKIGCREGDCGACTVLVGELQPDGQGVRYQSMTSCLTPLGNAHGKHIVTVEGINAAAGTLTPVQQAIVEKGGSQCGFCTVGFVMSLTGHALSHKPATPASGLAAIDGNICRCTGYKSLERATAQLTAQLEARPAENVVDWLSDQQFVPTYFKDMPGKLQTLQAELQAAAATNQQPATRNQLLGGGTDLLVQRPEQVRAVPVELLYDQQHLRGIRQQADGRVVLGAAATAENLRDSALMNALFPRLYDHLKLVSSTPIRNMGTVAGNFVNASPIGDLTIFFLALDARITLETAARQRREIQLRDLYRGYKTLTKEADEQLVEISFEAPAPTDFFNFEKVSKRTHLDIASVNSAAWVRAENGVVQQARLSAGGVGPTPLFLTKTAEFLVGKAISADTLTAANEVMQTEISPIGDARGTAEYKRLLLRQLLFAHFLRFAPERLSLRELV